MVVVLGHTEVKGRAHSVRGAGRASVGTGRPIAIRPAWVAFAHGIDSVWVCVAFVAPVPGDTGVVVRPVAGFLEEVGRGTDMVAVGREVGTGAERHVSGVGTSCERCAVTAGGAQLSCWGYCTRPRNSRRAGCLRSRGVSLLGDRLAGQFSLWRLCVVLSVLYALSVANPTGIWSGVAICNCIRTLASSSHQIFGSAREEDGAVGRLVVGAHRLAAQHRMVCHCRDSGRHIRGARGRW